MPVLIAAPEDSEPFLGLVGALVSTAGSQILGSDITGDYDFLKVIVALVLVDVYMLLDGISSKNALERYPQLDRVYKLLSCVVQFVAESGETIDPDTILVVYRKLVETCDTIVDFLYIVANQHTEFAKNDKVVLMSVRTLAAMLSEITEDPSPKLLSLLPFFNLLCQNVEYADDVVSEVKNATLSVLANIKSMSACAYDDPPPPEAEPGLVIPTFTPLSHNRPLANSPSKPHEISGVRTDDDGSAISQTANIGLAKSLTENVLAEEQTQYNNTFDAFGKMAVTQSGCNPEIEVIPRIEDLTDSQNGHTHRCTLKSLPLKYNIDLKKGSNSNGSADHNESYLQANGEAPSSASQNICLSPDIITSYRDFQSSVAELRNPASATDGKVSFYSKNKKKHEAEDTGKLEEWLPWRPTPDDVLGYLLPAYAFLLDHEEALEAMLLCGTFNTVVAFLEKALSDLLEFKRTCCSESTIVNALAVIDLVYTNSPASAAKLECFQELYEISLLSLPNLMALPHPPSLVSLKLLEVFLSSYRVQMRDSKRNASISQLHHSQARLFKSAVEYLKSFYKLHKDKNKSTQSDISIKKEFRNIWSQLEPPWCGCIAGLCTLVRSVEELQEALAKSPMIPDFLIFLRNFGADPGLGNCSDQLKAIIESMITLIETAAEGSRVLRELIHHNHGGIIASKYRLPKLGQCLLGTI